MCCRPFAAGVEKLLVHRGRVVALLDQFDLEIAGIGERHAHLHGGVLAAVAEVIGLDPIDIVPGPDAHHVDPVIHRGADIAHDISVLADRTKDSAHHAPSACRRRTRLVLDPRFNRSTFRRRATSTRATSRPEGGSQIEVKYQKTRVPDAVRRPLRRSAEPGPRALLGRGSAASLRAAPHPGRDDAQFVLPNSTGNWRGPRTVPSDQVTLPAGSSLKSGIRFSHSSIATVISMRARLEPTQR